MQTMPLAHAQVTGRGLCLSSSLSPTGDTTFGHPWRWLHLSHSQKSWLYFISAPLSCCGHRLFPALSPADYEDIYGDQEGSLKAGVRGLPQLAPAAAPGLRRGVAAMGSS